MRSFSSIENLDTVIHSFTLAQNAAARLLIQWNSPHTPILASLHWLTLHFRSDITFLMISFKACCGIAPDHITDLTRPFMSLNAA